MFKTNRLTVAMRFANSLHTLTTNLTNKEQTEDFVYNLALRHVQYWSGDASIAQANMSAFLKAVLIVFDNALDEQWTQVMEEAWGALFSYVGEAMVAYVNNFGKKILMVK